MKTQNRSITAEQFVRIFIEKETFEEVAKELNISISSVKNRAYALKRSGVKLETKKKQTQSFFGSKAISQEEIQSLNLLIDGTNK